MGNYTPKRDWYIR